MNDHNEELNELKRKKAFITSEIENKKNLLLKLNEENIILKSVNKNLLTESKDLLKEQTSKTGGIANTQSEEAILIKDEPYKNYEIQQYKDQLHEMELNFKAKRKYYKELRRNLQTLSKIKQNLPHEIDKSKADLTSLNSELCIITDNFHHSQKQLDNLDNEKQNLFYVQCDLRKQLGDSISSLDKHLQEKKNLEENITIQRKNIQIKNETITALEQQITDITMEIETNQNEYVRSTKEKCNLINEIKQYQTELSNYENFTQTTAKEITVLQDKFKTDKETYKKIDTDLNRKLYFIKFSNSLVRSFFNIINTRRLQIEIIKKLKVEDRKEYEAFFLKLDLLQAKLEKEYKDYSHLCGIGEVEDIV